MQIKAVSDAIQTQAVDAIIIYLFENMTLGDKPPGHAARIINEALGGGIQELIDGGDFSGKSGQVATLYPRGAIPAKRVILVGMGPLDKFSIDAVRCAAATGIKKARELKAVSAASALPGTGVGSLDIESSACAVTEGCLLGLYSYHGQKTGDKPDDLPETLYLTTYEAAEIAPAERGIHIGSVVANGTMLTRNLVNLPPNICTPSYLAQAAREIAAEVGLSVEVLEEKQIRALKMGAFLAVAQGSDTPPRFIVLEHNAGRAELETIVLVGKGITFDTGGYDLKPADSMAAMKDDMAGAAAVLGALYAIGKLDIPLHAVGLIPSVDNMISGHSYRPQEVFTASNGKTIEVINTDAEGRMLLADALVYAGRYNPSAVVDIATLTGACMVALGSAAAGLFATDATLRDTLISAGTAADEKVWPLPLFPEYEKQIESQTADVKHVGATRYGGASIGATFLKQFISYPAWAHVDMAGMAVDIPDKSYIPDKGASGYGVHLLTEFAMRWAQRTKDKE